MNPQIKMSNLKYRWPGQRDWLLDMKELSVLQGEKLFIRGASGSGKSTFLNLLGGVITPQQGRIEVLGTDIGQLKNSARDVFRGDHFGFIFQQFNLLPYLNVIDNVTLTCRFSELRMNKAIKMAGSVNLAAGHLLDHLGIGGKEFISKQVTELSMGQQQRVATARALIGFPEIIIADEPTSSLDADAQQAFIELLFRAGEEQGSTVIFVSHDERFSKLFDRSIEMASVKDHNIQSRSE